MLRLAIRGHLTDFPLVLVRNDKETATTPKTTEILIRIQTIRNISGGIRLVMLREVHVRVHKCLA